MKKKPAHQSWLKRAVAWLRFRDRFFARHRSYDRAQCPRCGKWVATTSHGPYRHYNREGSWCRKPTDVPLPFDLDTARDRTGEVVDVGGSGRE